MSLLGRKRGRAILASAVEPLDDRVAAASPHCAAQPLDEDGSERSLDAAFAAFDASCLPSDTLVALRVSRRRFPLLAAARARRRRADAALTPAAADELRLTEPVAGCAAVPLSLLYEAAPDRLAVDRELAALQRLRFSRRLKLQLGDGDAAAVLTTDLRGYLRRAAADAREMARTLPTEAPSLSSSSTSSSTLSFTSAAGEAAEAAPAVTAESALARAASMYFFAFLANAEPEALALSEEQAEAAFAAWRAAGCPEQDLLCGEAGPSSSPSSSSLLSLSSSSSSLSSSSSSSSSSSTSSAPASLTARAQRSRAAARAPPLHALLRELVQAGLLVRRRDVPGGAARAQAFLLGLPESGLLVAYLRDGRAELVQRLRRGAARELPRAALEKGSLARSGLPVAFHVRDAVGCGLAVILRSPVGDFVRLR